MPTLNSTKKPIAKFYELKVKYSDETEDFIAGDTLDILDVFVKSLMKDRKNNGAYFGRVL